MKILGIILTILGLISTGFGITMNNSFEAQLNSFLSSGSTNPGSIWIFVGIAVVVVGLILTFKKSKKS